MWRSAAVAAAFAVASTVGLAACGDGEAPPPPEVASPLAPCSAAVVSTPGPARAERAPRSTVLDLTLPCFTGGEPVVLARLGRPAVISLWASSCQPCREELPELQAFADASPRFAVLGVVTGDRRSAAASLAGDLGITFPSVDDPDRRLLRALGRMALPVTLFVDAAGVVRHEDVSGALTANRLRTLATRYLGRP